jgi:hypothetical protein
MQSSNIYFSHVHHLLFLFWYTSIYSDSHTHARTHKINELKAKHQAGGRKLYTWQKQPQDIYVFGFGLALTAYGTWQLMVGHYRLATGKGKLE